MMHSLDAVTGMTPFRGSRIDTYLDQLLGTEDLLPFIRALRDRDRVSDQVIADWCDSHDGLSTLGREAFRIYRRGDKLQRWCAANGIDLASI